MAIAVAVGFVAGPVLLLARRGRERPQLGGDGLVYLAVVHMAITVGAFGGFIVETYRFQPENRWFDLAAAVLGLVAIAGMVGSQHMMGTAWNVETGGNERLVTTGPFAMCRNPIYLAVMASAASIVLAVRDGWSLAALVAVIAVIEVKVRTYEEPDLVARFGADYNSYRQSTGRFVPGVGIGIGRRWSSSLPRLSSNNPTVRTAKAVTQTARLRRPDNLLGVALGWSAAYAADFETGPWYYIPLCLLMVASGVALAGTLDDIQGFRDGSDATNYSSGTKLRPRDRKPLVTGSLTLGQAWAVVLVVAVVGVASSVLLAIIAPVPGWWLVVGLATIAVASQYSVGIKLTYRRLMELTIVVAFGASVFLAYVLFGGSPDATAWLLSTVFGLSHLSVSLYSNLHDRIGDALVGRRTLAVVMRQEPYLMVIAVVLMLSWLSQGLAMVVGAIVGAVLPVLVAIAGAQALVLNSASRGLPPIVARSRSWWLLRLLLSTLIASNVLRRTLL